MQNLNNVTTAISTMVTNTREKLITQQQETTMNATMRRGGKQGSKKGSKQGSKKGRKQGSRKQKGGEFIVNPNDPPNVAFSATALKNECLNDLEKDIFNSRNRIFVVDGKLPTYNAPTLDLLKTGEKQLEDELANKNMQPGAAISVGGRRTRKQRKHKKSKTRRMRR
jgi:hypothetical protein